MTHKRKIFDYMQAEYTSKKHYHVLLHELPDGKRRELILWARYVLMSNVDRGGLNDQ